MRTLLLLLAVLVVPAPAHATHRLGARLATAKATRQACAQSHAAHVKQQVIERVVVEKAVVQQAKACVAPAVVVERAALAYPAPAVHYFVGAPLRLGAGTDAASWADYQAYRDFQRLRARESVRAEPQRLPPPPGAEPALAGGLAARCAKCHTGANAAGRLVLDGSQRITLRDLERATSMLRSRRGPDEMRALLQALTDAEAGAILVELFGLAGEP